MFRKRPKSSSLLLFPTKTIMEVVSRLPMRVKRTFKEFRRRIRQMDSFPNEDSCLRCIYALSSILNESWCMRRIDGFDSAYKSCCLKG
ncbi:MAG TPA: hypothetical protein DCK87_06150 [Desulfotomaculum sp.]|nr:hypothetical protein [Desulfotomaculum sp.]